MRLILAAIALALILPSASAQKQEVTLRQAAMQPFMFQGRPLTGLQWHPDGIRVTCLKRTSQGAGLFAINADDGSEELLVGPQDIATAAQKAKVKGVNLNALVSAAWHKDGKRLRFTFQGKVYHYDVAAKTLQSGLDAPGDAEATAWAPEDAHVAWSKDKNVFVKKPDGSTFQVTHDGFEFLTHGLSVSRVEFGIKDGLWWDPTGRRLAFYREDLRPIQEYPYIRWDERPAAHKLGRYPMAGRPGSVVTVGVYDTRDDKITWLKTNPEIDQYLTNVTWCPEGKTIYIAHVNRAQNQMDLKTYDAATGAFKKTLFTEKDEQWVEPEHGPIFLPDDSGDFLWHSYREGFRSLYVCSAEGKILQRVTTGNYDVTGFHGFSPDMKHVWFDGTGPVPIENHLFAARLLDAEARRKIRENPQAQMAVMKMLPTQLTPKGGQHTAVPSKDGKHFYDTYSSLNNPLKTDLVRTADNNAVNILRSPNAWERFQGGTEELFTIKAKDGSDLHGHIILPPNLDESKKYPVLLYVYGGPHSQLIKDEFGGGASFSSAWYHYMACQGMIVIRLDGHGTAQRGIDFIQAIHRNMGRLEVEDQIAALEHLFKRPYADRTRVGVHGWSYGGFMTLSLMTRAGDYFKCGISGAPVTDWAFYETGYGERYMDTPEENPDGYKESKPATHLKGLKGRLLVVQGTSDETVVWQHTLDFIQSCIDQDKPVEYMVYPGQLHGLRGKHRWHFYQKMTKFFLDELTP